MGAKLCQTLSTDRAGTGDKLNMNAKYRAKDRRRLAGVVVFAAWLIPQFATAEDGNLTQQLRIQQHKSGFQLMLEQVQRRARQRTEAGRAAAPSYPASPAGLGDWTQSPRLDPIAVATPVTPRTSPDSRLGLAARQAHERDQRRILDHRQQRRALIAGAVRTNSYPIKRRELVRSNVQNQRQSLQRKLRP